MRTCLQYLTEYLSTQCAPCPPLFKSQHAVGPQRHRWRLSARTYPTYPGQVGYRSGLGLGVRQPRPDCLLTAQSAANSVLPSSQQLWRSPVVDHVFTLPPHRHRLLTASLYSSTPVSLTSSVIDILRLFDPFPVVSPRDAIRDEIGQQ